MKKVFKKVKKYLIFLISIIIFCILLSLLNLLGINTKITLLIQYIAILLFILIFNYKIGKNNNKKGIIIGISNGLIITISMFILSLILYNSKYNIHTIIYYIVILLTSLFGAILGKNKSITFKK